MSEINAEDVIASFRKQIAQMASETAQTIAMKDGLIAALQKEIAKLNTPED